MKKLLFIIFLSFNINATEVCFTPQSHCTDLIVKDIMNAKHSIEIQAYSFTSEPIALSLVDVKKRGIRVEAILDKTNITRQDLGIVTLKSAGIAIWIDDKVRIAHNKVIIIDDETLITGSFNFTTAAQYYNAENIIIVHDPAIINAYKINFEYRKSLSKFY